MMGGGLVLPFRRFCVTGLALYTIFFTEIGRKTPYCNLVAIFSTWTLRLPSRISTRPSTELTARLVEEGHRLTHAVIDAGR
jgi:hypothetical protein